MSVTGDDRHSAGGLHPVSNNYGVRAGCPVRFPKIKISFCVQGDLERRVYWRGLVDLRLLN